VIRSQSPERFQAVGDFFDFVGQRPQVSSHNFPHADRIVDDQDWRSLLGRPAILALPLSPSRTAGPSCQP
jgi:hypothetical protein